jgi:predicted enzyme related to lactoylglutathione lyase
MITSIAFTVYPVSDMARARRFYEQALGLTLSRDFGGQWVEYDLVAGTFAITTYDTGHQPRARGASVGFEVQDLDVFAERLKAKGVPFVLDTFSTLVCRMAVIEDPDKNHLVIHKHMKTDRAAALVCEVAGCLARFCSSEPQSSRIQQVSSSSERGDGR